MREKIIKIYKFDELSKDVQRKVIDKWRDGDVFENYDGSATLEAFERIFPVQVTNYDYGDCTPYISFEMATTYNEEHFSGVRLMKYISNNYFNYLYQGRYYSIHRFDENRKFILKKGHSKVMFESDCPLTGAWSDQDIIIPLIETMNGEHVSDESYTFEVLMEECLGNWVDNCHEEYYYWLSDESIIDDIEANDCEFTEEGDRI